MITPDKIPDKAMFKVEEVAQLFSVKTKRIYEWISHGKIEAVKIISVIRIPYESVAELKEMNGRGFMNKSDKAISNRMVAAIRGRIHSIYKGQAKDKTSMTILGCSREKFVSHIEKQFKPGMTFENYGQWHIDHIIPCAQFDLSKEGHRRMCFHYTNLQPMWASDNIRKGKKLTRRSISQVFTNLHNNS